MWNWSWLMVGSSLEDRADVMPRNGKVRVADGQFRDDDSSETGVDW